MADKFDMPQALFLLGSLKSSGSSSRKLASMLKPTFDRYKIKVKEIILADKNIKPGIKTDLGDDFVSIFEEMKKSDIIVFVTPIWWGEQSSLLQRVIERLDTEDTLYQEGKQQTPFLGKIFGVVVSGAEDGSQNIIGRFNGWASYYGFVIPPFNSLSYLGDVNDIVNKGRIKSQHGRIGQDPKVVANNLIIAALYSRNIKWSSLIDGVTHGKA